jgi:MFS family permease
MNIRTLLKNPAFKNLWFSQICSQLSYNLLNFSLLFIVFRLTHSSFSESLLVMTFILPTALFGTFTGVFADFYDKRRIMMAAHLVWPLVAIMFVFFSKNLVVILFLSFLINAIDRFFTPAEQSSLPFLVSKEELLVANSLFSFSINGAFLVGFSLAGPIMILTGNDFAPIYLSAILMASSIFFVQNLPRLKPEAVGSTEKFIHKTFNEIKLGFSFIKQTKVVFLGIAIFSIIQIFMNIALSISPSFVSNSLGFEDPKHASWVVMFPVGLGSIVSLYVIQRWQKQLKRNLIGRGIIFSSISLFALGFIPVIYQLLEKENLVGRITRSIIHFTGVSSIIFIACFFLGLSVTLILVPALTAISENTPEEMLGRVWGIAALAQNLLASIPLLLFGFIADRVSVVPLIFVTSAVGIVVYFWGKKKGLLDKMLSE